MYSLLLQWKPLASSGVKTLKLLENNDNGTLMHQLLPVLVRCSGVIMAAGNMILEERKAPACQWHTVNTSMCQEQNGTLACQKWAGECPAVPPEALWPAQLEQQITQVSAGHVTRKHSAIIVISVIPL